MESLACRPRLDLFTRNIGSTPAGIPRNIQLGGWLHFGVTKSDLRFDWGYFVRIAASKASERNGP